MVLAGSGLIIGSGYTPLSENVVLRVRWRGFECAITGLRNNNRLPENPENPTVSVNGSGLHFVTGWYDACN